MKRLALGGLVLALVLPVLAAPAAADDTPGSVRAQAHVGSGTLTVPTQIIYGRPNRPMVSIVVRIPTAAAAAGAAHDQLRLATVARSEPAALGGR